MKNDWPEYEKAWDEYKQKWKMLDDYLYKLCEKNPGHDSLNVINAKVWIIGRTYATGIERNAQPGSGQALERITKHLWENKEGLDLIFDELKKVVEPLSTDNLSVILKLHGEFNKLLKGTLRGSAPSFVSKYMHFHCPIVPIYDSIALDCLTKRYRWNQSYQVCDSELADEEYYRFCMRFWQLYEKAPDREKTVKRLDNYLLWRPTHIDDLIKVQIAP